MPLHPAVTAYYRLTKEKERYPTYREVGAAVDMSPEGARQALYRANITMSAGKERSLRAAQMRAQQKPKTPRKKLSINELVRLLQQEGPSTQRKLETLLPHVHKATVWRKLRAAYSSGWVDKKGRPALWFVTENANAS